MGSRLMNTPSQSSAHPHPGMKCGLFPLITVGGSCLTIEAACQRHAPGSWDDESRIPSFCVERLNLDGLVPYQESMNERR